MSDPNLEYALKIRAWKQQQDNLKADHIKEYKDELIGKLPEKKRDFWVNKDLVTIEQATKLGIIYGYNQALDDVIKILEDKS